jgi:dTDP-4-amino-4,6-dideoxygalactose transaminase
MELANRYNLAVVEDAAHAIDSFYLSPDGQKIPLGSIGHLATFSFHETKNISSGEGGLLAINDERFAERAEIIWEKGTNRASFFRGEVNKYGWVDLGSSFLPSEVTAAFLWAQLEHMGDIQQKRIRLWDLYYQHLAGQVEQFGIRLPIIPDFSTNNGHMFFLIVEDDSQREFILTEMKKAGVLAVFHYLSLHKSDYFVDKHDGRNLINSDLYSERLIRLPLYFELSENEVSHISDLLLEKLQQYAYSREPGFSS